MPLSFKRFAQAGAIAVVLSMLPSAQPTAASRSVDDEDGRPFQHVLLISIDGIHAVDFENCVRNGTCPALADLGESGVNYKRTSTSKPSDSAPGLAALVTGGTPKTHGVYYDVAYDRVLAPPAKDTGNGVFSGTCNQGQPNGTTIEYEEGVDFDQSKLNGGGPYAPTDGGFKSINPMRLPRDPFNDCLPVYPWNFLRTNTIYGVIHKAGGYTAWSDKHAVYASVSGPTGTDTPSNVDDYYSPDVNSDVVALPAVQLPNGQPCAVNGKPIDDNGGAWTDSFENIKCYDTLKVRAVLNWIQGRTHLGGQKAPVPTIFGMNFQAVSVGQKLIEKINGVKVFGGYTDAAATPTAAMLGEIEFVDASIGQMVQALKSHDLLDSTLIIITAKHGQSPIDTHRFQEIGKGITTTPADVVAPFLPPPPSPQNPLTPPKPQPGGAPPLGPIGPTQDDVSLLWLDKHANVTDAVAALEASGTAGIGLGQIFYGPSLEAIYDKPGVPKKFNGQGGDPRTPDIIVQPNVGVIYTSSGKKQAEHGGFAHDDTNVMMLVSNPRLVTRTVTSFVETAQVAPTILRALGLDPNALDAVRLEGTPVLPGLEVK
jgi:Type I phosphodiesterase / nucleotide pyrophosphatase